MELHRLIFRLDFPNAFSLFSKWGEVFARLHANGFWSELGEDLAPQRAIRATRIDPGGKPRHVLAVRVNDIGGFFEDHPIAPYRKFTDTFNDVSAILGDLQVKEFRRIGVRFIFLEPFDSFEAGRNVFSEQVSREYWKQFPGELRDLSLVSDHQDGDQHLHLNAGPISRKEYQNWFSDPDAVASDNALLFDVDCSTTDYKLTSFDFKKMVDVYYDRALRQAEALARYLLGRKE